MQGTLTLEQLSELTDIQKERLKLWWQPKKMDLFFVNDVLSIVELYDKETQNINYITLSTLKKSKIHKLNPNLLPLLSLTMCIEFLEYTTKGKKFYICIWPEYTNEKTLYEFGSNITEYIFCGSEYCEYELINVLWNVVKEKL